MTVLVPYSRFRAVDDDNEPLVGGLLYSYVPGTSTPKATYTDHTLGTPNPNPIVLNANGEATVYIDGDTDLTLEDATSVLRWGPIRASDGTTNQTQTNATLSGTLTVSSTAVTWSGNPTHSGNHTFTNNVVVNGNTTLGDSGADSLTIGSSAVTWSNNPTHSGNHTFSGDVAVGGDLDVGGDAAVDGTITVGGVATFNAAPAGYITSGVYTPTSGGSSNLTSITYDQCTYIRVGNAVTVSGRMLATVTAANTLTINEFTLPIASLLTGDGSCSGAVGSATSTGTDANGIITVGSSGRARMQMISGSSSGIQYAFNFHLTYAIN